MFCAKKNQLIQLVAYQIMGDQPLEEQSKINMFAALVLKYKSF